MKKKAQGLPLNIVIISVIVLVVLVVIWVIFAGRTTKFAEELNTCRGFSRDDPIST